MLVLYGSKTDLLYIRLDDRAQDMLNHRVSDDVLLDIGAEDRIVGIEIMDSSRRVNLQQLLSVECRVAPETAP